MGKGGDQDRLVHAHKILDDLGRRRRLACPWHAQDQAVIFGLQHSCQYLSLIRIEPGMDRLLG